MRFLWPDLLWLLLLVPLLVAVYVWLLRRKKKSALRYASLGLIRVALGPGQRFRRHLPPLLFLLALIGLALAVARPSALITLPSQQQTIVLAIDVSLSMRAEDVEPNRLSAAQAAAKTFIEQAPPNLRIGVVSFAGTASIVQRPTDNREDLIGAIDRFQLQRATATGSGIIMSLAALLPEAGIDLESAVFSRSFSRKQGGAVPLDQAAKAEEKAFQPVPPGSYKSGAIILLSDGRRTMGPDPIEAAKMAAERGVRVFTVGFGTADGGLVGFGGWSIYMKLDEETLKAIADVTQAEYFYAGSAADLRKVYQELNNRFVLERKDTELTALFTAAAALLALVAGALSILWFNRIV